MKRWAWTLVFSCVVVFIAALWRELAASAADSEGRVSDRQLLRRHQQCEPHHWRSMLLQR